MSKHYFLEGKLVGLRAFEEEDLQSDWFSWFNDPEVTATLKQGAFPNSRRLQKDFYESQVVRRGERAAFAVEDKASGRLIGVCSISALDLVNRTGDMAVIIGEKDFRKGGYALETFYLIVRYGFETLNLNKIKACTVESNQASLKNLELIGFNHVGTLHEEIYKNGIYLNCVASELLKKTWEHNKKA